MNSPLRIAPYPYDELLSDMIPMVQSGRFGQHTKIPTLLGTLDRNHEEVFTRLRNMLRLIVFSGNRKEATTSYGSVTRVELFCRYDKVLREVRHGLIAYNNRAEALFHVPDARLDKVDDIGFTMKLLEKIGIPVIVTDRINTRRLIAANYSVIFSRESHQRSRTIGPRMVMPGLATQEWVCVHVKKLR